MPDQLLHLLLIIFSIIGFGLMLHINSREIFGFYYSCKMDSQEHEGNEILWWLHAASKIYLGEKWTKPVCGCPVCMSSFHSFLFWIPIYILAPFSLWLIYIQAIYILVLAGVNYIKTSDNRLDL